jgi:hypothetical protein
MNRSFSEELQDAYNELVTAQHCLSRALAVYEARRLPVLVTRETATVRDALIDLRVTLGHIRSAAKEAAA